MLYYGKHIVIEKRTLIGTYDRQRDQREVMKSLLNSNSVSSQLRRPSFLATPVSTAVRGRKEGLTIHLPALAPIVIIGGGISVSLLLIISLVLLRLRHQAKGKNNILGSLSDYEIERNPFERKYAEYATLLLIPLVVLLTAATLLWAWPSTLIAAAVAIWALWLGYSQFIDIRNENSIDKFYDRLKLTNL